MMKVEKAKNINKKPKIKTPKGEEPTEEMLYQGMQGIYAQLDSHNASYQTDYNQINYDQMDYSQIDYDQSSYNQTGNY